MPVLTPSVLANLARCFESCVPPGAQLAVTNYLLAQIAKTSNPALDVTPSALANAARCFNSCIPPGMELAVMNYLLNNLVTGGGVGRQFFVGNGPPVGMQAGQTAGIPAQYQDLLTGILWIDPLGDGNWSGPN